VVTSVLSSITFAVVPKSIMISPRVRLQQGARTVLIVLKKYWIVKSIFKTLKKYWSWWKCF